MRVERPLGQILEQRKAEQLTAQAPKAAYFFFDAVVEEEKEEWPEMHKRRRQWMGYREAAKLLKDRPELCEALERSGIDKSR